MYILNKAQLRAGKRHVALANRVSKWLRRAGVENAKVRADIAVGIADSLAASTTMRRHLTRMLAADPRQSRGARKALHHAVFASTWMFDELLWHLQDMKRVWERHLENRLAKRVPD